MVSVFTKGEITLTLLSQKSELISEHQFFPGGLPENPYYSSLDPPLGTVNKSITKPIFPLFLLLFPLFFILFFLLLFLLLFFITFDLFITFFLVPTLLYYFSLDPPLGPAALHARLVYW